MKKNKLLYAGAIIGATAAGIYGFNKAINVITNTKSSLTNPHGLKYEWRFGNIFYTVQGSGKPVLLVHDLTCGSSDVEWKYIVKQYAKTNTVYTLDLIGCGRSDKPFLTYTNYLYVQLVTDFVKNVIGHRTDIIATGKSSTFVLMACYNDNTLFDKIVLINPPSVSSCSEHITTTQKFLKKTVELPLLGTLIYNIVNRKSSYIRLFRDEYFANPYAIRNSIVNSYYDSSHHGEWTSKFLLGSLNSNYMGANIPRALKEINNSITIVGGECEPFIKEIFDDYTELNSSIETVTLEGTKHLPQLEKPEELLSLIKIYM